MPDDVRADTSPLPSSGLVHLQARAAEWGSLLGPTWAALCGVLASNASPSGGGDIVKLLFLVLLVDGGWGTIWAALAGTNWSMPIQRWRFWETEKTTRHLPYTLPGSIGHQLSRWAGRLRAWWSAVFWPACGPAVQAILVGVPLSALLGVVLGPELLLLSTAALALMEMGVLWKGGDGTVPAGWDGLIGVTLPWMAGHATFGGLTVPSTVFALVFAVAWGNTWKPTSAGARTALILSEVSAAVGLVALGRPLTAGLVLLALVPQMALLPWASQDTPASTILPAARFVRYTRPWLMGIMVVAALVL